MRYQVVAEQLKTFLPDASKIVTNSKSDSFFAGEPPTLGMRWSTVVRFITNGCFLVISQGSRASGADVVTIRGHALTAGKPATEAVIWLDAPDAPRPLRQAVLDQRNLAFTPTVLAVSTGTTVRFPNSDRVLHNVFSFHEGKKFDLGLYPVGQFRDVTFDRPGVSRLFCNIHPGMAAYIVVVDSPYYAVTNRQGEFALNGVPPGPYTYHAWRAGAPTITGKLTVTPNARLEVQWHVE